MFSKTENTIKKVMIFGTFDIIHAGHESFFEQARTLGDYIIVVVARDETVKKVKGYLPTNKASKRLQNLKKSGLVNKTVIGSIGDKYEVIKKYRPDIIALGYDQYAFTYRLEKFLIDMGMNTTVQRLQPYKPLIYKTSILKQKLAT